MGPGAENGSIMVHNFFGGEGKALFPYPPPKVHSWKFSYIFTLRCSGKSSTFN